MKAYFKTLFEHEYWANLKVLESLMTADKLSQKAIEVFSHTIAAQRIWLDRINGIENNLKVWEIFETKIMLELLEINYADINKIIEINQLDLVDVLSNILN